MDLTQAGSAFSEDALKPRWSDMSSDDDDDAAAAARPTGAQPMHVSVEEVWSIGGELHDQGKCRPCAFFHTKGCSSGNDCPFCHRCPPFERTRRKQCNRKQREERKEKRAGKRKEDGSMGFSHSRNSSISSVASQATASTAWTATDVADGASADGSFIQDGQFIAMYAANGAWVPFDAMSSGGESYWEGTCESSASSAFGSSMADLEVEAPAGESDQTDAQEMPCGAARRSRLEAPQTQHRPAASAAARMRPSGPLMTAGAAMRPRRQPCAGSVPPPGGCMPVVLVPVHFVPTVAMPSPQAGPRINVPPAPAVRTATLPAATPQACAPGVTTSQPCPSDVDDSDASGSESESCDDDASLFLDDSAVVAAGPGAGIKVQAAACAVPAWPSGGQRMLIHPQRRAPHQLHVVQRAIPQPRAMPGARVIASPHRGALVRTGAGRASQRMPVLHE